MFKRELNMYELYRWWKMRSWSSPQEGLKKLGSWCYYLQMCELFYPLEYDVVRYIYVKVCGDKFVNVDYIIVR